MLTHECICVCVWSNYVPVRPCCIRTQTALNNTHARMCTFKIKSKCCTTFRREIACRKVLDVSNQNYTTLKLVLAHSLLFINFIDLCFSCIYR